MLTIPFNQTFEFDGQQYPAQISEEMISVLVPEPGTNAFRRYIASEVHIFLKLKLIQVIVKNQLENAQGEVITDAFNPLEFKLKLVDYNYFLLNIGLPKIGPSVINGIFYEILKKDKPFQIGPPDPAQEPEPVYVPQPEN